MSLSSDDEAQYDDVNNVPVENQEYGKNTDKPQDDPPYLNTRSRKVKTPKNGF